MTEHPVIARVRVYADVSGKFRWTAYSTNGEAIAVSSKAYTDERNAEGAAKALFPDARFEVSTRG